MIPVSEPKECWMPDGTSGLARPLVLVVEDEAALVTMLRYNLERQGFRVEEAIDGEEAYTRIVAAQPDIRISRLDAAGRRLRHRALPPDPSASGDAGLAGDHADGPH